LKSPRLKRFFVLFIILSPFVLVGPDKTPFAALHHAVEIANELRKRLLAVNYCFARSTVETCLREIMPMLTANSRVGELMERGSAASRRRGITASVVHAAGCPQGDQKSEFDCGDSHASDHDALTRFILSAIVLSSDGHRARTVSGLWQQRTLRQNHETLGID
jgi:hypothetical protein